MISAVAILMLCNGIRISLKSKKNTINEIGCVMEFMTHLFRFFIFSFLHFFHRISRMNRRHSCLSDYSRNFAELWPLANGSRPIYAPVVFCHADFADDADLSSWGLFRPTDFTDIHRFFFGGIILSHRFRRYTQIFLCVDYFVPQISQMTQIFLCVDYFVPQISQIYTDFSLWDFFQAQGVSAPTGQVASVKIRE